MVSYEKWVSIVRAEASVQGADLKDFETNSELVSVAADIWNDRKIDLEQYSPGRARNVANQEIEVR